MLGLILLLVLKMWSSNAVVTTVGSTITLECTLSGSFTLWQKWLTEHWSNKLQDSSKYSNTNTKYLSIFNIDVNDAGTYSCSAGSKLQHIGLIVKVTGTWNPWSQWTTCSKTCGVGESTRSRSCLGGPCSGSSFESMDCTTTPCPVHGNWGAWRAWSSCSETCGSGVLTRYRSCNSPPPANGGSYCQGNNNETTSCLTTPCPVVATVDSNITLECTLSGSLTLWQKKLTGHWSNKLQDSSKYGNTNTTILTIFNIEVNDAGTYRCTAGSQQLHIGLTVTVTGTWNPWSQWTTCSKTCGVGESTRSRSCLGGPCSGSSFESMDCTTTPCPVHGNWGAWTAWSSCSETCGSGVLTRYRSCNSPAPANGGSYCQGNNNETISCLTTPCPVNGNWGVWHDWNSCSVTCGSGSRSRYQECNNPTPAFGGSDCHGNDTEIESCSIKLCPVNGHWGTWVDWNSCSATCGSGSRSRSQECNKPEPAYGGSDCQGNDTEIESCSIKLCPETEALMSSSDAVPIVGGISVAVLFLVVIVIVLILVKRRRQTPHVKETTGAINNRAYNNVEDVTFRTEGRDDQMYINLSIPNRTFSIDTDDDILPTSSKIIQSQNTNMTYENIRGVNSCIKVEDLKGYIGRKQINEGLKEEYQSIEYGPQHPTTKSRLKENVVYNRYKTTLPYDHSRVILETEHGSGTSDYINANYIDGFEKDKCYIASQGPTKITIPDHWRMIWQNNVKKIVMLTNLEESGKVKCDRYWPVSGKQMTHGNLVLTLVTEKERTAYVTREISVVNKKTKEKRIVTQHHFTAWSDHGTPDPLYLVLFHRHVTTDCNQTESSPLLVHCSAGIGRTGTYIALDALLEEGRTTGYVNIAKFLMTMRYSRMNMIQNPHQYVCLHYALLEAFTMKDTSIRIEKFNEVWRDNQSDKRPINHQRINEEFMMLEAKKSEHESPECIAAMSTENINKNRNRKSVAMDSTRLYLMTFEKGRSNFINAVQVPSYTKFVGYLATQLPLPDTKVDFWTMIKDHSSSTIVLILNDNKEADLVYTASTDSFTCGHLTMKITKREQGELNITKATLIMSKKDDKPKEIVIYQTVCENMPDPQVLCRLVDLISIRISMSRDPVTVVSSDGAKNCGLFCTFANAVSSMKIDETADIFQLVRLLQLRRPECFSDFEEYRLCYEALNIYIESSNVYANF